LHGHSQVSSVALLQGHNDVEYDVASDTVIIPLLPYNSDRKIKVKLHGGISNGDIVNIFLQNNIYQSLPVKGKVVIDVGTNIGDSPIYFALSGADKIIGLEPYPQNYEIARKNVELNNLSDKITVLLAGCSSKIGYTSVDPVYTSGDSRVMDNFKNGVRIPLLTLGNILKEYNLWHTRSILKMDCEGCEYETILSSTDDILQKFSHIQIEYHYGYKNLKERLENSGFNVSVTKPMIDLSYKPKRIIGYIYADRN
jgi:FkbM family methyltransferase